MFSGGWLSRTEIIFKLPSEGFKGIKYLTPGEIHWFKPAMIEGWFEERTGVVSSKNGRRLFFSKFKIFKTHWIAENDNLFFNCIGKETKKAVYYTVKLQISRDGMLQASSEFPAGKGESVSFWFYYIVWSKY